MSSLLATTVAITFSAMAGLCVNALLPGAGWGVAAAVGYTFGWVIDRWERSR